MGAADQIMAMLCVIAGMLAFLTLIELGYEQKAAGNVLLLAFLAGGLFAINPTLGRLYHRFTTTDEGDKSDL